MTTYRPGDRVRLIRTADPYTTARPNTVGTVRAVGRDGTVHVSFDDGGYLGVIERAGDVIEPADQDGA